MNWKDFIKQETNKDYYKELLKNLQEDAKDYTIFPKNKDVFSALNLCSIDNLKVILLGQDPYIKPNQAHGLSFSVPTEEPIPPSLKNIFKELNDDLNIPIPNHGNLTSWARQGVLLLNSILTVRQGQSGSHAKFGWETFTDEIIRQVNDLDKPIVFLLWGNFAKSKKILITNPNHLVLESGHPSPLSARLFFGNKHFSKTNSFLTQHNLTPINWDLSENQNAK